MKRLTAVALLMMCFLSSAYAGPSDRSESVFFDSLYDLNASWKEIGPGDYVAKKGGKTYEFCVSDDGKKVTEIALHVPYSEMRMDPDTGDFPPALRCFNAVTNVLYEYLPDYDDFYTYYNAYELWDKLEEGRIRVDWQCPWQPLTADDHVLEMIHKDTGAYCLATVTDGTFHFYCSGQ